MGKLYCVISFVLCTALSPAQVKLEKVTFSFSGFKRPDTKFAIDYRKRELTCTHSGYEITPIGKFNKTYTFSSADFASLEFELSKDIPEKDSAKVFEEVLDGGGFDIEYKKRSGQRVTLHVSNPSRHDTRNASDFAKLDAFFKFAYSIVKDDGIRTLDESIDPYFRGAPIRKASDQPLEFYIWGQMSGGYKDNAEFFELLDSLSGDRCVIVDCRKKLCIALEEVIFERYIVRNSNIRFANMETLERRKDGLQKIRSEMQQNRDLTAFNPNSFNVRIYSKYREEVDDWLALPENRAFITLDEARKSCD